MYKIIIYYYSCPAEFVKYFSRGIWNPGPIDLPIISTNTKTSLSLNSLKFC